MMSEELYTFKMGYSDIRHFKEFKDGKIYNYSYLIHRDKNGMEISRTDTIFLSEVGFDNGKPLTKSLYEKIIG